MRIVYVLLSPTFGMHQYTGDLAAQMVQAGHEVHVVTTRTLHRDRYPHDAVLHTVVSQQSTGFRLEGLQGAELRKVYKYIVALQPDIVHFSGVHLWNPLLVPALRRQGLTVVHTMHDLDPHPDVAHAPLIRLWNRGVIAAAHALVVHGDCYRHRLLAAGHPAATVLSTPLLHSFLAASNHARLVAQMPPVSYEPWVLFFGRLERYKGLDVLLEAQRLLVPSSGAPTGLVIAGGGDFSEIWPYALPQGVTLYNRRIVDDEGYRLLHACGVLVLPYTGATQSALPATAYAFGKPVIVTTSGALPEVVTNGITGWVVPAGDPHALAQCIVDALMPARLAAAGTAGRQWYEAARCRQQRELGSFYNSITSVG